MPASVAPSRAVHSVFHYARFCEVVDTSSLVYRERSAIDTDDVEGTVGPFSFHLRLRRISCHARQREAMRYHKKDGNCKCCGRLASTAASCKFHYVDR